MAVVCNLSNVDSIEKDMYYLYMTLRAVLEYDEVCDSWAAYCPELPGITSCGDTETEALENFKEAAELFFEPSEVPVPATAKILQMVI